MLVIDGFGTKRLRVDRSREIPYFLEMVGLLTIVCGLDLP